MYPRIRNVILVTLFALLAQGLAGLPLAIFPEQIRQLGLQNYYLSGINILIFGSLAIYGFRRSRLSFRKMWDLPAKWGSLLGATILLTVPVNILGTFLAVTVFNRSELSQKFVETMASNVIPDDRWAFAFLAVVVAPLTEEIFFRGFIFRGILKNRSVWTAGIISTLLFALVHLNPSQVASVLVVGSYAVVIFHLTKSLLFPITIHVIYNACLLTLPVMAARYRLQEAFYSVKTEWYTFDIIDAVAVFFLIIGLPVLLYSLRKAGEKAFDSRDSSG